MTPENLAAAGRALYGEAWQTKLAEKTGYSARHVRRMAAGYPVPEGFAAQVRALMKTQRITLAGLIRRVK